MGKIKIDDFADEIIKELKRYNDVTYEEMQDIAKSVAKEGSKKLKETSPRGKGSRKGHYADGWSIKAVEKGNGKFGFVIHNRKKPGLTHLLEKGHQLQNGGRARAIPHIKPVEEWCNEEYEKRLKKRLQSGL